MSVKIDHCPACGDSNPLEVATLDGSSRARYLDFSQAKYAGFLDGWLEQLELAIDCCSVCGHHWYREQPDQEMLSDMYAKGRPLLPQNGASVRAATSAMVREMRRLNKVLVVINPSLLDYGSGFGRWARAAIHAGFKVTAYEPSEERGVEKSEIDFTLVHDVADLKNHLFDVINLEQVLEHVPDPVKLLKELRSYCAPDTVVRITVPNILRCPEGKDIWKEWPYNGERAHTMAPFEHLQGFTPFSLRTAVIRAGFVPLNNFRTWFLYPGEMIRGVIGKWIPGLGQTLVLIRINNT